MKIHMTIDEADLNQAVIRWLQHAGFVLAKGATLSFKFVGSNAATQKLICEADVEKFVVPQYYDER